MKNIITLFFLLIALPGIAQDLSGLWIGTITQSNGTSFYFEMDLLPGQQQDTGILHFGRSYIAYPESDELFAIMELEGLFNGSEVFFREYAVFEERVQEGSSWCIKSANMQLSQEDDYYFLNGTWEGQDCGQGTIAIKHFIPSKEEHKELVVPNEMEGRFLKIWQIVDVESKNLTISLWDTDQEDGDQVALNLNGEWIYTDVAITKEKKSFETRIYQDSFLILHAHNLGDIPPNTVSISVDDGKEIKLLELKSDLSESAVMMIRLK